MPSLARYCVIGHPVAHSRSPWIHTRFAALTGQVMSYTARLAELDAFTYTINAFRTRGGKGCNITVPFKEQAAQFVTHPTERVKLAMACNTLRFGTDGMVEGDNTDGVGLVRDITLNAGVDLQGRDVLLIGAGGAAAGALGPLIEQGPKRLVLANRTLQRAQLLVQRHAPLAQTHQVQLFASRLDDERLKSHRFAVVINASSTSLAGASVPVPANVLQPGALAVDMMYGPPSDAFLTWAKEHGGVGRDGLGMLVEQAAEAFEWWRGVRPPAQRVLDELRVEMLLNA